MTRKTDKELLFQIEENIKNKVAKRKRIQQRIQKNARAAETKKMILIGKAISSLIRNGTWSEEKMIAMMDEYLTNDNDRKLFNLPSKKHP